MDNYVTKDDKSFVPINKDTFEPTAQVVETQSVSHHGEPQKKARGNSRGNSINGRHRKDERRAGAFAREAARSKMTVEEKLERLDWEFPNKDQNKRQRARYEAQIAKK